VAIDDSALSRTSAPVTITVLSGFTSNLTLISTGSVWRYRDTGEDLGSGWVAPAFVDAGWSSGPAQLGYGDGDERTVLSFGPNASAKYITTYFRHAFVLPDAANISEVTLRILRDDGVMIHLNGAEIYRNNLPAGNLNYLTTAPVSIGGADESAFLTTTINPGYLVPGTNVMAVEIHQNAGTSSDISFDLGFTATVSVVAPRVVVQPESQSLLAGQTAVFNVGAEGTAPLRYQWRRDEVPLPGANAATLTLSGIAVETAGSYSVVITNVAGFVTSLVAVLTVTNPDTDGDGLPDWWEVANGTNPNQADASQDLDGDSLSNLDEYRAGTRANDSGSYLKIDRVKPGSGLVRVEFQAVSNRTYTLLFKNTLNEPVWSRLGDIEVRSINRDEHVTDTNAPWAGRLYRLVTPRIP
jgi:hypothetical protein